MGKINYPVSSDIAKYAYLYRLQELLRLEHNKMGKDMTKEEFEKYREAHFNPKSQLISDEICKYREILKKKTNSKAKLTNIEI